MKQCDPEDRAEFVAQVKAEPHEYRFEWRAYDPKIRIVNECFPRPHETYNCTTCSHGLIIPEHPPNDEEYVCRCKWDGRMHIGPKWNDIECRYHNFRDKRPRHGYNELER